MKTASIAAIILFALVSITHIIRIVRGVNITIDGYELPIWVSVIGVILPAAVAYMLWKQNIRDKA